MIIERLIIRNYRRVKKLELEFSHSPTVLPEQYSETIVKAIGILTKNEVLSGGKSAWILGKNAFLTMDILLRVGRRTVSCRRDSETGKTEWKVFDSKGKLTDPARLFSRIHEAPEESRAGCFDPKRSYEEVMRGYLEPERYFTSRQFFRMTEGIGRTRLFRMKLRDVRNHGLSAQKGIQRNYEFFLRINFFWDEIEAVRDMHHEKWPLFIWTERPEKMPPLGECENGGIGKQMLLITRGA